MIPNLFRIPCLHGCRRYDAVGRATSVTTSAETTTLDYDFESRLVSMSGPGISATYAYNGLDARRGKTMNGVARSYLRDGAYVTDPLLHDGEVAYTPGASVREYGATKYLHGGLKNADAQSSSSQTLTATRGYDAFGNVDSSSGSWTGALGYGGPYGYQSASEGGLMLLGHRYYDPSTGRFLTRDPIKDGRNWYAYGAGDLAPTLFADPDGQIPLLLIGIAFVIGGGTAIAPIRPGDKGVVNPGQAKIDAILALIELPRGRSLVRPGRIPGLFIDHPKRHEGFRKQLPLMKPGSILKAVKSLEKQIQQHQAKLQKYPESIHAEHWRKEIRNFVEQIQIAEDYLRGL